MDFQKASESIKRVLGHSAKGAKETLDVLQKVSASPAQIGAEVEAALGPGSEAVVSSRVQDAFDAFWESSGVVLLDPQPPKPQELASRFLPALDKFLVASNINLHNAPENDTAFLSQVRGLHHTFRQEVIAVVALCCQFTDALEALLETQRAVRPVSQDEHSVKSSWVYDRFVRLLDSLLSATTKKVGQLQKKLVEGASTQEPLFAMKDDEIWRPQRQRNVNFAKQPPKVKRKPVEPVPDGNWLAECEVTQGVIPMSLETLSWAPPTKKAAFVDSDDGSSEQHPFSSTLSSTITQCPPPIPQYDLPCMLELGDPLFPRIKSGPLDLVFGSCNNLMDEDDDWFSGLPDLPTFV